MNEKQQTAVEQFIEQLEEQGHSWENASLKTIEISIKVEDYLKLKQQAKEMHLEQIMEEILQKLKDKIYEEIVNSANNKNATFRGGEYRIGLRKAIDIIEQFIEENESK
jgi:hypothetical protein